MRGSARIARAIATRCRWPPESFTPRSPTTVSYFFSNRSTNSSQCAMRLDRARSPRASRPGCAKRMFSRDRAVEQEVVLQHDAELRAVVAQAQRREVAAVDAGSRPLCGRLNAITRLMSVLLPEPLDPTSAVVVPAGARNETCFSTGTPALYSKRHVLELDLAARRRRAARASRRPRPRSRIAADLADAVEPGEGFGDLRADRRDLDDRRGHQAGEEDVHDEVAERHRAGEDRAAADDDHDHADDADDHGRRTRVTPRRRSSTARRCGTAGARPWRRPAPRASRRCRP